MNLMIPDVQYNKLLLFFTSEYEVSFCPEFCWNIILGATKGGPPPPPSFRHVRSRLANSRRHFQHNTNLNSLQRPGIPGTREGTKIVDQIRVRLSVAGSKSSVAH